jgi:hypothetical protein
MPVCIVYRNAYILYIQYVHTLQIRMSTSRILIKYMEKGCQSRNPQDIHCFKRKLCVRFARLFQERNPDVKRDLPVLGSEPTTRLKSLTASWWWCCTRHKTDRAERNEWTTGFRTEGYCDTVQFVRNVSAYHEDKDCMLDWYVYTKLHGVTHQARHSHHTKTDTRSLSLRHVTSRLPPRQHAVLCSTKALLATHKINKDTEKSWRAGGGGASAETSHILANVSRCELHCVPPPHPTLCVAPLCTLISVPLHAQRQALFSN